MECTFDVRVRLADGGPGPFEALFALEPGGVGKPATETFVERCADHFGEAGRTAAQSLMKALAAHREILSLTPRPPRDDMPVWEAVYGSSGMDIASDIADFLAALSPGLSGDVEGDYDEDPWGFRYTVAQGRVEFEEGFLADGWEEVFDEDE